MSLEQDSILTLENVHLTYASRIGGQASLKGFFIQWMKTRETSILAQVPHLKKISFSVSKGEQIGIVGRNGSGKSTLLKLIAGILRQDEGKIHSTSKSICLVDLQSGMHPDLTCEENIILSCSYFGWSPRKSREALPGILEWSELQDYSQKPLNTLSTGMQSRLAFAVATSQSPDLLLVDEAISVGDIDFQEKSQIRLSNLRENGGASLIVTHDLSYIRKTTKRTLWLRNGEICQDGSTEEVLQAYEDSFHR